MSFDTDIVVIGAGPAGLSFCKSLENSGLSITLLEKNDLNDLQNPAPDGREIALTHKSKEILKELGAWDYLSSDDKYFLREAEVFDGDSPYSLHFSTPSKALGEKVDTLGYLISNHNIRKSLYENTKTMDDLSIKTNTTVVKVESSNEIATVTLNNGEKIQTKLIVAADSRFSMTRRQMGIGTKMNDFGRTVIVFRMKHKLSNKQTAIECFYYGRTLAILPLTEKLSSIVITIDSSKANKLLNMSANEIREDIISQLDAKLGDMELVGKMHSYPLVGVHANQFYEKRYALIGDAAVGMHPVTAHGFNLGLSSQLILTDLIKESIKNGQGIADINVLNILLKKYSKKHIFHTRPLYLGTNIIVKLFTTETLPAKIARKVAIRAGNLFLPFKKIISKQLTG